MMMTLASAKLVCARGRIHRCGDAAGALVQRGDQVNVLLHCRVGGRALEFAPSVPFGPGHEVAEPRFCVHVVTHAALFVERIEFEQGGVVRALGKALRVGHRNFKLCFQVGHSFLCSGLMGWG